MFVNIGSGRRTPVTSETVPHGVHKCRSSLILIGGSRSQFCDDGHSLSLKNALLEPLFLIIPLHGTNNLLGRYQP